MTVLNRPICFFRVFSASDLKSNRLDGLKAFIWSNLCTRHIPNKLTPRGHEDWPDKRRRVYQCLARAEPSSSSSVLGPALQSELRRIWLAVFPVRGGFMRERSGAKQRKVRGKQKNTQFADGLGDVVRETTRLWRKHHLGYDQTKYVVE